MDFLSKNRQLDEKILQAMKDSGLDGLLIFGSDHLTYLTQVVLPFAQSYMDRKVALVFSREGGARIICPPDWVEAVQTQGWQGEVISIHEGISETDWMSAIRDGLKRFNLLAARVGVDDNRASKLMMNELAAQFSQVKWTACGDLLNSLRLVKVESEVRKLEGASRLTERGFVSALNHLEGTIDPTSYSLGETAERLRVHVAEFGGQSSGHNSASQGEDTQFYYTPMQGRVREGGFLRYELTSENEGYWSSGGRTVWIGKAPAEAKKAYQDNLVLKAVAIDLLRPGVLCNDVFTQVENTANKLGIPLVKEAGIGYGLGTSEREAPFLNPYDTTVLVPGIVLALDIFTLGPHQEFIHSVDTYVIEKEGSRLLSWYRLYDRLYEVVGITSRHG
jgi:Xaa-Pro dipeptidase